MKTLGLLRAALLVSLSFFAASCGDDDSGSTNNTNPGGEYVSAKVNGEAFGSSTLFDAVAASNPNATTLVVQGSDNGGNAIQIMLLNFDGEGTYNLSNMINGQLLYTKLQGTTAISYSSAAEGSANGTAEITLVDDTKVEGNFSFTGRRVQEGSTETVNVTEGSFRANFQ
ncbi:MAG: DUF6252 family protein [Flavobacterium sp.]